MLLRRKRVRSAIRGQEC